MVRNRSLIHLLLMAPFACASVPAVAAEPAEPPARILWSPDRSPGGVNWNQVTRPTRKLAGPSDPVVISPGESAACVLDATAADWKEHDTLELDLTSDREGTLTILFRERDPAGIECWVCPLAVASGSQTLRIRLVPEPQGPLRPALPQRDRAFNPEGEGPIDITFLAGPSQVRLHALTLRRFDR